MDYVIELFLPSKIFFIKKFQHYKAIFSPTLSEKITNIFSTWIILRNDDITKHKPFNFLKMNKKGRKALRREKENDNTPNDLYILY